jgi:hypothetical protein
MLTDAGLDVSSKRCDLFDGETLRTLELCGRKAFGFAFPSRYGTMCRALELGSIKDGRLGSRGTSDGQL